MKTILAATDFGPASRNAVNYAARLAIDSGAKLILLHATHIPIVSDSFFDVGLTLDELQAADKEEMEKLNASLRKKFGATLKLEEHVKVGFTDELIRSLVKKGNADLVVMGIGQIDALTQAIFGSTSAVVAGSLNCPVLIVPEKAKYRPLRKLAFTFDQRNIPTGTGLKTVCAWIDLYNTKVHYVHVLDSPMKDKDDSALKPVFRLFKDTSPTIHYLQSVPGKTVEIINDFVRRYKAQAIVMVSRQHNIFWKLFNERTTKKMAFNTKVPLLVVSESKQK